MDRNAHHGSNGILPNGVALRKESVDRNSELEEVKHYGKLSLSARRAWIEMVKRTFGQLAKNVALRKESVDRNFYRCGNAHKRHRRSPQGERG